jgi:hypothetical protein
MTSTITKGMPYGTMRFENFFIDTSPEKAGFTRLLPTIVSEIPLASAPIIDQGMQLECGVEQTQYGTKSSNVVKREIELHGAESDFTWLVFVSEPVIVNCRSDNATGSVTIQVLKGANQSSYDDVWDIERPLFIRSALSKLCTSNKNAIYCHQEEMLQGALNIGQGRYDEVLRNHSHIYSGRASTVDYEVNDKLGAISLKFDWDAQNMIPLRNRPRNVSGGDDLESLLVFALPHHLDLMGTQHAIGYRPYCAHTLIGPACLLVGSSWTMTDLVPPVSFRAPRPPAVWSIKPLADSLRHDINFTLPKLYLRGGGDTYFSGKMLAKQARILLIAEEITEICGFPPFVVNATSPVPTWFRHSEANIEGEEYRLACSLSEFPSDDSIKAAIASLRDSVQVWLDGSAETPFVYDTAWGGIVSCGCDYNGKVCTNSYPNCIAFDDPGMNFGNGK